MNDEIYYIDFGTTKRYYKVQDDNKIISRDGTATISKNKFLDFLATAKELGHKTGRL